jgi:ankyrin repeat protein
MHPVSHSLSYKISESVGSDGRVDLKKVFHPLKNYPSKSSLERVKQCFAYSIEYKIDLGDWFQLCPSFIEKPDDGLLSLYVKMLKEALAEQVIGTGSLTPATLDKGLETPDSIYFLFQAAVDNGFLDVIRFLVSQEFNPNCNLQKFLFHKSGSEGKAAVHRAIDHGDVIILEFLYSLLPEAVGLDWINLPDEKERFPLHYVFSPGRKDRALLLQWLLTHKATIDRTTGDGFQAIHFAIKEKDIAILELLLKYHADCNARDANGETPLHHAAVGDRDKAASLLLQYGADPTMVNEDGDTPLHLAVKENAKGVIQALIEYGIKPNQRNSKTGCTLFHLAAQEGDLELLKLLANDPSTADIHRVPAKVNMTLWLNIPDDKGLLPLHYLFTNGNIKRREVAQWLLDHGSALEKASDDDYLQPVHCALSAGDVEMLEFFLAAGASASAMTKGGESLLLFAVDAGDRMASELLLQHGASLLQEDEEGRTPLLLAILAEDMDMLALFLNAPTSPPNLRQQMLAIATEESISNVITFLTPLPLPSASISLITPSSVGT